MQRKGTIQYNTGIEKKKGKLKKFTKKAQNCCKYTLKKIGNVYIMIANEKNKRKRETNMATREKNIWILMVFILSGLVIGGLIGEFTKDVDFLWWLSYGQSFGLSAPIELDLNIVQISFGLMFKINVASILGMIIAVFIYKKI